MTALNLVLVSLSLLPYGWGYSITSSLGPTAEYSPYSNPSTRSPVNRVFSGVGAATVPPSSVQLAEMLMSEGALSEDSLGGGGGSSSSHLIHVRDSSNTNNYRGPYSDPNYNQNQYTPTQLQMASRILFESRASTPKPYLGYRSYISSYRNPNYFGKPLKIGQTRYLHGPNSKHPYPSNKEEQDEQGSEESSENGDSTSGLNLYGTHSPAELAREISSVEEKVVTKKTVKIDVTTPESKTAPATADLSLDLPTERPSSTQEMRSDGLLFAGSESNNQYQLHGNNQWLRGYTARETERSVQISTPCTKTSESKDHHHHPGIPGSPLARGVEEEKDFDYDSTVSSQKSEFEETIAFPTTTNPSPKPFYKLPEGEEFSKVRNIVELRKGGNETESINGSKNVGNDSKADFSKEKLSPVGDGNQEPTCANHLGYCDNSNFQDSYPKELINSVLTNSISSDLFKKIFSDVDGSGKPDAASDVMLVGRNNVNPLTQETPLCHSQEVTIYPRAAKNKDDKWMFIVNHDDYVQGVKVEKCMSEGSSCLFGEGNPLGYESVCRQKFILRKLVALNDEGKTSLDTFKLPSCCVCFLKTSYIEDRTGAVSSVSRNPALSDKASNSSGQNDSVDVVAGASDGVPTECVEPVVLETNRNSSSLLPDLSHATGNSTTQIKNSTDV